MKKYNQLSPDELREYHRSAWRRYYQRNKKRLNEKKRLWELANPEKTRIANNRATRKYREKTRLNNQRQIVLSRDNYCCQNCGNTKQLVIHHKDEVSWHNTSKPNNNLDNLVTLCRSCHTTLHNLKRSRV
jgi:5-methylcytosine-specific restriction endonuclease McrA